MTDKPAQCEPTPLDELISLLLAECDQSNWDHDMRGKERVGYANAMDRVHEIAMYGQDLRTKSRGEA